MNSASIEQLYMVATCKETKGYWFNSGIPRLPYKELWNLFHISKPIYECG